MKQNFSENLKRLRKKAGMTQEEFAKAAEISSMTARRWEWGQREPRIEEVKRIAAALGVSEAELLNGPEENKITIELVFEKLGEEELINMSDKGNKFKLFLGDDGTVGISGGAKFESRDALKDFAKNVIEQLEFGFDCQVQRGALPAGA